MTPDYRHDTLVTYERTCGALLADPDVTGDLLLIGLWFARATILRDPPPGEGRWSSAAIALTLFGKGRPVTVTAFGETRTVPSYLVHRVHDAIRQDIPRYDPFVDNPEHGQRCGAPMPRAPFCRRSVMMSGFETDPETGRMVDLSVCGRKDHQEWYRRVRAENKAALVVLGDQVPVPAANTGGALARHIRLDWPRYWRKLRPDWRPPAEGAPTRKPALTVLRNDEFEPVDGDRPALTVHDGGWR